MNDALGDRMKLYEGLECDHRLMPLLPVVARIDGRAFHSFTKGMNRPYDERLSKLMIETTRYLVQETNACMGYTQSDEITLTWYSKDSRSQIWFDGRVSKMTSQLAAHATLRFNQLLSKVAPEYTNRNPTFDARVWTVPNQTEAANVFLWREWDAAKNSISMAASALYPHKQLEGKNSSEKQEMLFQKGVNWNNYPPFFKRGAYIQRRSVKRPFNADEIQKLPPKHEARTNPTLMVERSEWKELHMPEFSKILNRNEVIFAGQEPIISQ